MCQDISMDERYVVDKYNPLQNNSNVVETFHLQMGDENVPYCIRRIPVAAYEWGKPQLEDWQEQDWETDYSYQYAYETLEAAKDFVRELKRRNGR